MNSPIFDIEKDLERVKFVLEKKDLFDHIVDSKVVLTMDVSGSMQPQFQAGIVQKVIERILPLALACANDSIVKVWGFSSDTAMACDVSRSNYKNYVQEEMTEADGELGPILWQSTRYAPPIKACLQYYGLLTRTSGFFGIGARDMHHEESASGAPIINFFVTDGENEDPDQTRTLFEKMQAAESQIYYLFIGVGSQSYSFIKELAEDFSNIGFLAVEDLGKFVEDDGIYESLIPDELCVWLRHEDDDTHKSAAPSKT